MEYTTKIENNAEQAKSLLNLLFTLAKDYDFLQIYENNVVDDSQLLSAEQEKDHKRCN